MDGMPNMDVPTMSSSFLSSSTTASNRTRPASVGWVISGVSVMAPTLASGNPVSPRGESRSEKGPRPGQRRGLEQRTHERATGLLNPLVVSADDREQLDQVLTHLSLIH